MMTDTTSIYLIGAPRGLKKVGLAKQPALRIRSLQTGHGSALSLLYACLVPAEIASDIERRAHWLLKGSHTHGEWFTAGLTEAKEAIDRAVLERGEGEKVRPPVGRPPLSKKSSTKPILVRLTADVCDIMDALAGPNRRAEFIREAIEREIKRRSRQSKDSE